MTYIYNFCGQQLHSLYFSALNLTFPSRHGLKEQKKIDIGLDCYALERVLPFSESVSQNVNQ